MSYYYCFFTNIHKCSLIYDKSDFFLVIFFSIKSQLGIALGQEQGDDKNNDDEDDDFNPVNIVATVVFMSIIVVLGVSYYKVHILDIEKEEEEEEDEYTNKANLL